MVKSLKPAPEPIKINGQVIIIGSFIFALLFCIIGVITKHYVWITP